MRMSSVADISQHITLIPEQMEQPDSSNLQFEDEAKKKTKNKQPNFLVKLTDVHMP